ncbi:MAG: metallophosphoesterase [Clostridia bacterium]|nr:metallophosphoesterase [Clostridia bacterium]
MRKYRDPLFAPEPKSHTTLVFILLLLIIFLATVLVLNHINNNRVNLAVQSVTVPSLTAAMNNYRILHISDLHGQFFGAHQERLQLAIANARYNIVVITGDVTGKNGNYDAFLTLLDLFNPSKTPVYFIPGDEDPAPIESAPNGSESAKAEYIRAAEAKGAIYLDAPERIDFGKNAIWLWPERIYTLDVGNSEATVSTRMTELENEPPSPERDAALRAVKYHADLLARIRAARRITKADDIHIAVTHHPLSLDALTTLREWTDSGNDAYVSSVSLVLAGHYNGGQWRLPFVGAVKVPASAGKGSGWFPGDMGVVGLSSYQGIPQYISPGLGASSVIGLPAFRLFNTPQVTQIILTTRMTN